MDDKWQATLKAAIAVEIERVTQQLVERVKITGRTLYGAVAAGCGGIIEQGR